MPSNPAPRAALSSAEGSVVRPALRRRAGGLPVPPVPAPPTPTDMIFGPAVREVPPIAEPHKAKGKKGKESVEVVVVLTKPVRKALKAAAAERDTTPEALAALVLSTWLDR